MEHFWHHERHAVDKSGTKISTTADIEGAIDILAKQEMYRYLSRENLVQLAKSCEKVEFEKGDLLVEQGTPTDKAFFLARGNVSRFRTTNEQEKILEKRGMGKSINSLHHLHGEKVYASARCDSPDGCTAYCLKAAELDAMLKTNHSFTREVVRSLQREVRTQSKLARSYKTPIFDTQQRFLNVPAVTIAAGIESYYRSALNAFINYSLTGKKADYFPNMGIQVPSRIIYILGFKYLRYVSDHNIDFDSFGDLSQSARLGAAVLPGMIMCPVSSVLEAANAGHFNSEPMAKRWTRGFVPRIGREVIFGVGLNQLSDALEERIQGALLLESQILANMLGSLSAGIVAGYLSHVPHNLSTLKLMYPQENYTQLFQKFVQRSLSPRLRLVMESTLPKPVASGLGNVLAILFPRGCMVRTVQIVGTFIILNSTINVMTKAESRRVENAVSSHLHVGPVSPENLNDNQ